MSDSGPLQISIKTRLGTFTVGFSHNDLVRLQFPDAPAEPGRPARHHPLLDQTRTCLEEMLSGRQPQSYPPMDLSVGTKFQQSVWRTMLAIPPGETMTYGEVAQAIGNSGATQAVGTACGMNPIPLIVPCHRILGSNGIGGFSSGLDWKIKLLQIEGVTLL